MVDIRRGLVFGVAAMVGFGAWTRPVTAETTSSEHASLRFDDQVEGAYAHFDVVAYEEKVGIIRMRTLVITYGMSEFFRDAQGQLMTRDVFCHAEHRSNLPFKSTVPDAFTRAIVPRLAPVTLTQTGDGLSLYRPATPTPIGIKLEDPEHESLPMDPHDPRISDDDGDGKPGVTVKLRLSGLYDSEIYIARREIFAYHIHLGDDGIWRGQVRDDSEQLVVGSPLPWLRAQRNPKQHPDRGLSPIELRPLDRAYDCDELMEERDRFFPPEPAL